MGSHLCVEAGPVTAPPELGFWCCTTRDNIQQDLHVDVPAPTPGAALAGSEGGAWRGATTGTYRAWEAPRIHETPSLHVSPQALRLLSPSLHPDCSLIGPGCCGLINRDTCGKKASKGSFDIGGLDGAGAAACRGCLQGLPGIRRLPGVVLAAVPAQPEAMWGHSGGLPAA
ncbi:uncharacterized protein LOC143677419 isoform X2 [Tamandua tetradactyla]|uniref:uncharacterized protein LOC143677419 isoform X2 n=1 Tax=Tamandua tetradactyla TaxID=48850 RepID=UPI0040549E6D